MKTYFKSKPILAAFSLLIPFAFSVTAQSFRTVYSFPPSGSGTVPMAGVIQGNDGKLYGTTSEGGMYGHGTVFSMDLAGANFTLLHQFQAGSSDGADPAAPLLQTGAGELMGATSTGGTNGEGTLFSISTNGSVFEILHDFGGSDGVLAQAGLIQGTNGTVYGVASDGGTNNNGTVFELDSNGKNFQVLHVFSSLQPSTDPPSPGYYTNWDGKYPRAKLLLANDGNLYGTAQWGGTNTAGNGGNGTVFRIVPTNGSFTTIFNFVANEGYSPEASLIQGRDGKLYGTTYYGGSNFGGGSSGYGTIFSLDTNGSNYVVLHYFADSDGANPDGPLLQASDGRLYGTTLSGGTNGNYGTVFRINPDGTGFSVLHDFNSSDGKQPYSGLIQATDGELYGTTSGGGAYGSGTVFAITIPPSLEITNTGAQVILSWPAWATNYDLETSVSCDPGTSWTYVNGAIAGSGTFSYTNSVSDNTRFFRLHHQ